MIEKAKIWLSENGFFRLETTFDSEIDIFDIKFCFNRILTRKYSIFENSDDFIRVEKFFWLENF